jgi:N-acetyl-anhydromuramyl-L-alanine amidase AmpD
MRIIDKHIIHCSDTPDGRSVTVDDIRRWHVNGNGWSDIGYHFVIYQDGTIHQGRPFNKTGAHCKGHNTGSIGTCLVGRNSFSEDQFKALVNLHEVFKSIFPDIKALGHKDLDPKKTCPNFNVQRVIS